MYAIIKIKQELFISVFVCMLYFFVTFNHITFFSRFSQWLFDCFSSISRWLQIRTDGIVKLNKKRKFQIKTKDVFIELVVCKRRERVDIYAKCIEVLWHFTIQSPVSVRNILICVKGFWGILLLLSLDLTTVFYEHCKNFGD